MRFRKPIVALSTAGLLALAACGGSDSGGDGNGSGTTIDREKLADTGTAQDPEREGPVTIEGAEEGGTVTVLTSTGLTTTLDPNEAYFQDTTSILSNLVTRSLTQFAYDEESGSMTLVPDLATDLGQHNEDFTEWKFTIRDGVKWENGDPVTAEEVAFGIVRSMDTQAFPGGAGLYYSNPYFLGGDTYKGPYTGNDPQGTKQKAVSVDGNTITIKMSQPFYDMHYYGAFPSMGPIPLDPKINDPAKYRQRPLSTGPYKIDTWTPAKELILVRNDQWDPDTDPARTAYPDSYEFKAGQVSSQIDQIIMSDQGDGQTTLTYDDVLAKDFRTFEQDHPERLVVGASPSTAAYAPDYRTVPLEVRKALLWAMPYKDIAIAAGYIPDINALPATNIEPPGTPGREEFELFDHGDFETDPEKAKQMLEDSGDLGFELKFLWRTDNPDNTKVKDALVKGLEAAGFTATPVPTTEAKYTEARDDVDSEVNLRSAGWIADWPSGSTWIPIWFGCTDLEKVGFGFNYSAFCEEDIEQKIEDTYNAPPDEQQAMWSELDKEVMTTYLPVIPTYYQGVAQIHGSRVQGHMIDTSIGMPTWRNIWVSGE